MNRAGIIWLELALAAQEPYRRNKLSNYSGGLSWDEVDSEFVTLCRVAARYFVRWRADCIEIDPRIIEILNPPQMPHDVAKAKLVQLVASRLSLIQGAWTPVIEGDRVDIRCTALDSGHALEVNVWETLIQLADAVSACGLRLLLCDHCGVTFVTETKTRRYHSPRCEVMANNRRRSKDFQPDVAATSPTI